jgi:hypothetical protein
MKLMICLLALLAGGFNLIAQGIPHTPEQQAPVPRGVPGGVFVHQAADAGLQVEWVAEETTFSGRVVKGAPYSGEAVTEVTRMLPDGNRIYRKSTTTLYRDSQGRTRRELRLGAIGPWPVEGQLRESIFINDPVSGIDYVLDSQNRTAQKLLSHRSEAGPGGANVKVIGVVPRRSPPGGRGGGVPGGALPGGETFNRPVAAPKTESLGKRFIEGVQADGTRTTMTIPAGQIGNERPIEIVSERWYSPELQTVVFSKRTDPMSGDTLYRLTNISRSEPSPALFQVPPGYTLSESPLRSRGEVQQRKPRQSK